MQLSNKQNWTRIEIVEQRIIQLCEFYGRVEVLNPKTRTVEMHLKNLELTYPIEYSIQFRKAKLLKNKKTA